MATHNQFALLRERRFAPFFITQFLGAFNDNVYKSALIILIAQGTLSLTGLSSDIMVNLCSALFVLPFFLFSATSGQFADKYEKSMIMRRVKLFEIGIMLLAGVGFYTQQLGLLLVGLFLMGLHSTIFGPVKYGILPQHLEQEELIGGNGLVEMGTFVAILLGTLTGGGLVILENGLFWVAWVTATVALLGYVSSCFVPKAEPMTARLKVNWNFITETFALIRYARSHRTIFLSILGISWFWFLGALFLAQLPNYTKYFLGGEESVITVLITMFSVGVGIGSLLCERLSGHKVEIGLVPFGSIGLSLFGLDLCLAVQQPYHGSLLTVGQFLHHASNVRVMVDLLGMGIFGGFYIVPLYAFIQTRAEPGHCARVIATNNILNALFMTCAAVLAAMLLSIGLTIPQLFAVIVALNVIVAVYIYTLVPEFLMRFLVWLLIHTFYRIRHVDLHHVPEEGAALLVCNHVSYVDALIIAGCCPRPVRFVMDHRIYNLPILNFVFRTAKTIPIAPAAEDAAMKEQAFDRVAKALEHGELVCIFPEGRLTSDGAIGRFKRGMDRILQQTPVPVIPLALQGLWGSFFSRKYSDDFLKWPRRFWSQIVIVAGVPVPPEQATAELMHQKVAELRGRHA